MHHLSPKDIISLWQHYLALGGDGDSELGDLYLAYLHAHNFNQATDPFHGAHGVRAKEEEIGKFQAWVRAQPEYMTKLYLVDMPKEASEYTECTVGAMRYRAADKDDSCQRTTSFCLVNVGTGQSGRTLQVCKVQHVIRHCPPWCVHLEAHQPEKWKVFIKCWWLLSPDPCKTTTSGLPLVVWPHTETNVKQDGHTMEGMIQTLIPAEVIHPRPVCGKYIVLYSCSQS